MTIELGRPGVDALAEAVEVLQRWAHAGTAMQLHPGDVGWFWRFGPEATAAALRTWRRDGQLVAVGLLDGPELLRLAIAPDAQDDDELARRVARDVTDPQAGVLPAGRVAVETWTGLLLRDRLAGAGWPADEPWTPLRRDLAEPVPERGVRIEVVGAELAQARAEVHRASFPRSTFTADRWHAMAAGVPYDDARCLVAFDDDGCAVAAVTVWPAGRGAPGLLEPMGVHREHRGHGYGTAITLAAAAALRELGSSSAVVCTPSSNAGGVATYESAGFERLPEVCDRYRDA